MKSLREAAEDLVNERCREEIPARGYEQCDKPAEFVLWQRLTPASKGLGPLCYDHAAKYVGHVALAPPSAKFALMDLRPVRAALAAEEERSEQERLYAGLGEEE
jgi:hypothetical protein